MEYKVVISPKMREVENLLQEKFVGMSHCITDTRKNLIVEVPKQLCDHVREVLKQSFQDVALIKNAYSMVEDLHDFILVKPIISESPVFIQDGVAMPEIEKLLVDHESDKEYASLLDLDIQIEFQKAFELYTINTSRLLRYAARKGKKEEIQNRIQRINQNRVSIVHNIQHYLLSAPVEKAWIFGSFSRMEERPDSDIDILVDLDKSTSMGLLQYARMINELECILKRKVDMVVSGSIKPFAEANINRDKILVYERT